LYNRAASLAASPKKEIPGFEAYNREKTDMDDLYDN